MYVCMYVCSGLNPYNLSPRDNEIGFKTGLHNARIFEKSRHLTGYIRADLTSIWFCFLKS